MPIVWCIYNRNYSDSFPVRNGAKRGAVISPMLVCIYIDKLVFNLKANGIGCLIGKTFVAALAYADVILLIAPTSRAMRRMLSTCDRFANILIIVFYAKKSERLIFEPTRKAGSFINPTPVI